jgi:hypothetical protein
MNRMYRLLAVVGFVAVTGFILLQALPAGAVAGALLQGPPPGYQQGPPPPPPPPWDPSWNRRPLPPVGACFYTNYNFTGNRFCMNRGVSYPSLPGGYGNNISSIQIFGRAQVRIFNDSNFRNGSTILRHTVRDLRRIPFVNGHTWNNRISSIQVF